MPTAKKMLTGVAQRKLDTEISKILFDNLFPRFLHNFLTPTREPLRHPLPEKATF